MTYGELFQLLESAGLSPEAAAKRFGVSNMTFRRWKENPPGDPLPEKYERAFKPVIEQLAGEGKVGGDAVASAALGKKEDDFRATLKNLGFPEDILKGGATDKKALAEGLKKVGEDPARAKEVDKNTKKLLDFGKWGEDWKERVGGMVKVIKSADLAATDKLVAYGALFYLLSPIDLIPDTIPVIGYLDDFVILGIALWYYRKKFPKLFKKSDS